jgi:hypothetical protein
MNPNPLLAAAGTAGAAPAAGGVANAAATATGSLIIRALVIVPNCAKVSLKNSSVMESSRFFTYKFIPWYLDTFSWFRASSLVLISLDLSLFFWARLTYNSNVTGTGVVSAGGSPSSPKLF